MHSVQKNYIQAEASEKIRRALRHQMNTYADERYENRNKVFYKHKNCKEWKGGCCGSWTRWPVRSRGTWWGHYRIHRQLMETNRSQDIDPSTTKIRKIR